MGLRPSLKRRYRRHADPDLNVTPFIDILVCLILFLLVTAVLGRASILNLYLPTEDDGQASAAQTEQPAVIPTLAITTQEFILSRRPGSVEHIPKKDGAYDFERLRQILIGLRAEAGYSNTMVLLPEGRLRYQTLITTMDTVREYREGGQLKSLFPVISVGEFKEKTE